MKKIAIYLFLLAFATFLPFVAKAQESTSISISPLTFDLSANPGDTVTNELRVTNKGDEPIVISIEAQDFEARGEEGEVALTDEADETYSLEKWIEIQKDPFELGSKESETVKFVIRIPHNAEPGGHYAGVFAHVSPTFEAAQSGSYIGQKISSLVLMRVSGDAKVEAKIESFSADKNIYEEGPVNFNLRIKNTGSLHIRPQSIIGITDIWGNKVANVSVEQNNVLPGAIRKMNAKWDEDVPFMGKFTASLIGYYGSNNQNQIDSTVTFWIIPYKFLAVVGVALAILAFLIWKGRRRINKAIKALAGKH